MFPPKRIVCLTEETVETLFLLEEDHRIVGVSDYAVRPPQMRKEKPLVSAFVSADVPRILVLEPDLVLAFSDLQANVVAELIRACIAVHAFNQRNVDSIFAMIRTLGALVGSSVKADALARSLESRLSHIRQESSSLAIKPRISFEERDEPMISGIGWVSELIESAGGVDVFAGLSRQKSATERIVSHGQVIAAAPDIIIGSWCGKKFAPKSVSARAGFTDVPAVRNGFLRKIKS